MILRAFLDDVIHRSAVSDFQSETIRVHRTRVQLDSFEIWRFGTINLQDKRFINSYKIVYTILQLNFLRANLYKFYFCIFKIIERILEYKRIQRKQMRKPVEKDDDIKRSIVQERKEIFYKSQRYLLRSQYVLLRLQRNREKNVARCSRGCLQD